MPTFKYEAVDGQGRNMTATIEALTHNEAVGKIHHLGCFPTKITPLKAHGFSAEKAAKVQQRHHNSKIKTKIITEFIRELATLQEAGLPLLRSLRSLERQEKSRKFKQIVGYVADDIEGGMTLSEAMARHPKCFDDLFVGMVEAGEKGGVLESILIHIADFMEKGERLKSRVKNAMVYPIAVLTAAFAILMLLMTFVIPRFESVIREMSDKKLNVITQTVFGIASWIAKDFGWAIILAVPFAFIILLKFGRKFHVVRNVLDSISLKLPVIGGLTKKISIARWTRTLGTLLGAGVPILEAIDVTARTTGNEIFSKMLKNIAAGIKQGDTFVNPMQQSRLMPDSVENMIAVGEETGDIDKMLIRVADKYDERVDLQVNSLVLLLEPVMIIFLGIVVLFIVLAIFLPILFFIANGSNV
jgi:type IV pilus assembly protein PilC